MWRQLQLAVGQVPDLPSCRSSPWQIPDPLVYIVKVSRAAFLAFLTAIAAHAQSIPWQQHQPLTWNDFKGRPRRNTGEPSAVTDTGFRAQLECRADALDIRVAAEFYPNSSWVKIPRKSIELLHHEQGHFDLTELYARKMRKAIRDSKLGCEAEAAGKKILAQLDREWEKAEKQYDAATSDGTDPVQQKEASEKIAQELAELSRFNQ
jgi:hypothetical protein